MGRAVVKTGNDTYAGQPAPNQNHASSTYYRLWNATDSVNNAYIYMPNPAPRGATVTHAVLTFYAHQSSNVAGRRLEAALLAESWKVGQLTWNNRPSIRTDTAIVGTNFNDLPDGQPISIDVTPHVQAWANGLPNYGWRITTNSTVQHYLRSLESTKPPTLTVEWSDAPSAPTNLRPSGGIVGTQFPVLQCDYSDVSGRTELAAVQVQIDADKTDTPDFDSGTVAAVAPQLDLSTTGYAGLPTTDTFWRVRVQDAAGLWSPWSAWSAPIRYAGRPTVTITNPPDVLDPTVTEPTPPVTWTFTGVQTAWRVRVGPASDYSIITHDSGKRTGTLQTYTLPSGVLKDGTGNTYYSVRVDVWDDQERVAAVGAPVYSGDRRDFHMVTTTAVPDAVNMTAAAVGTGVPKVQLTWERSSMPDQWVILRGSTVVAVVPGNDLLDSGTTYKWVDYGPPANAAVTYTVRAVVNGQQSAGVSTVPLLLQVSGIWLTDPSTGQSVAIAGDDQGEWAMPDEAATLVPLGASEAIRVTGGMRGYEGSLSGYLIDGYHGMTLDQQAAVLWDMKSNPAREYRLTAGDLSIPVVIGDVVISPTPISRAPGQLMRNVSFSFWQTGEYPFTPKL